LHGSGRSPHLRQIGGLTGAAVIAVTARNGSGASPALIFEGFQPIVPVGGFHIAGNVRTTKAMHDNMMLPARGTVRPPHGIGSQ
jgi:hypothetical protein